MWWIPFIIGAAVGFLAGFFACAFFASHNIKRAESKLEEAMKANERMRGYVLEEIRKRVEAEDKWGRLVEMVSARTDQAKEASDDR